MFYPSDFISKIVKEFWTSNYEIATCKIKRWNLDEEK
jgi:hypothetical protein